MIRFRRRLLSTSTVGAAVVASQLAPNSRSRRSDEARVDPNHDMLVAFVPLRHDWVLSIEVFPYHRAFDYAPNDFVLVKLAMVLWSNAEA